MVMAFKNVSRKGCYRKVGKYVIYSSNTYVQRHNGVFATIVQKMTDKIKDCPFEIAVHWAVAAKNSLRNVYGFSPNNIVLGRNPRFQSVLNKNLSNSESFICEYIDNNLAVLLDARNARVQQQASERFQRAFCGRHPQENPYIALAIWFIIGELTYQILMDQPQS